MTVPPFSNIISTLSTQLGTLKMNEFIALVESFYGEEHTFSRKDLIKFCEEHKITYPQWLTNNHKVSRGAYKVPTVQNVVPMKSVKIEHHHTPSIPKKDANFIPFGFYDDLKKIVNSGIFYPVYITGETGSGKTFCVEQICAQLERECIRVNFSVETDQTDLLGGPTLINGNIHYNDGPVLTAMRNGSILLLDELDRCHASNALILNGILEGSPYYNPKNGETVYPKEGFNIIATANTKGFGSEDGKYLSQILDSAFIERFAITWEQEYPDPKVEKKILKNHLNDNEFIDDLIKWTNVIRQTYEQGGHEDVISTRRLVHIAKTYNIFGDKTKAIELCVSRFDTVTKNAFIDLFNKITNPEPEVEDLEIINDTSDDVEF